MVTKAQEGNDPGKIRTIQVAMDVSEDDALIVEYHDKLMGSLFAGIFLCAGIGFSVARKTLGPLGEITKAAERITVPLIAERLDPERWPTELRTLAAAFNSMLDRLEQSFTRLSQFSSDLAHELRTPINNLIGEAEIAISHGGTPDEFRHTLESSLEELARLSRIIDSLLFLARAENPKTRIECTRFEVYGEVKKLCVFYEWTAEEKGVTLTCSGSGFIAADLLLVNRAVSNLISNALKYTSSPGKVEVIVRQPDDHSMEITVRDTGLGIEQKDVPYIFDRFFRSDSARSKCPQGAGLGLAIVKSIMDLHGGAIDIQSEPGLGTAVTLLFTFQEDSKTS
jgi:two-component system heavy metal sensor histidine kinase CusS